MRASLLFCTAALAALTPSPRLAAAPADLAPAINTLGLDLYRQQIQTAAGQGVLLSPYSIAAALAMTYAGADGATRSEMQRVLHFPGDVAACSQGIHAIDQQLRDLVTASAAEVASQREDGGNSTPLSLQVANRLFIQQSYPLRSDFRRAMAEDFGAKIGESDFIHHSFAARTQINQWVADSTHQRIKDLLPVGQPSEDTRLVLVNALYLKAAWRDEFREHNTKPLPFHLSPTAEAPVPTMLAQRHFRYAKRDGYSIVIVPYQTGRLQCVLLVPDAVDGLAELERTLTAADLAACTTLPTAEVILYLPKFKLAPDTMPLGAALQALGLKTAFDHPRGSADFGRMAPRRPDDYLYVGEVFHKTWLELDEHGTEAAAATAVVMLKSLSVGPRDQPPPVVVRADRPFLFAIQHVDSGACLFLGRVTDPR